MESTQIKICVKDFYGDRSEFRLGLDDFLAQLLQGGRQEWFFLDISEGNVTLWLANQAEQQREDTVSDSQQTSEGETEEEDSLQDDNNDELESGWETVDDDTDTDSDETSVEDDMTQESTSDTEMTSGRRFLKGVWNYALGVLLVVLYVELILRW